MAEIVLTKGQVAIVDDEDYEVLRKFSWQAQWNRTKTKFYAVRNNGYSPDGTRLKVKMHRQIMGATGVVDVDHRDGDTLNNRRSNLRICSHGNNIQSQASRGGKSQYRGVTAHNGRWRARITVEYKRICLGVFDTELEAHEAWKTASMIHYGEFA